MDTSLYVDELPLVAEEHEVFWLNVEVYKSLCMKPGRSHHQAMADALNLRPGHRKGRLLSKVLTKMTSCHLQDNTKEWIVWSRACHHLQDQVLHFYLLELVVPKARVLRPCERFL
jgi:hypothetical protein